MSQFFLDHGILKKTLQCDSVTHSGHVSTIFGDSVSLPRKRDISDRLAFDRTVYSAFNELGYNEISEFLNIHFFKTDFF